MSSIDCDLVCVFTLMRSIRIQWLIQTAIAKLRCYHLQVRRNFYARPAWQECIAAVVSMYVHNAFPCILEEQNTKAGRCVCICVSVCGPCEWGAILVRVGARLRYGGRPEKSNSNTQSAPDHQPCSNGRNRGCTMPLSSSKRVSGLLGLRFNPTLTLPEATPARLVPIGDVMFCSGPSAEGNSGTAPMLQRDRDILKWWRSFIVKETRHHATHTQRTTHVRKG